MSSEYLEIGQVYTDNQTRYLYKYVGVVDRFNGDKEHEFQCLEFDSTEEDDYMHFSTEVDDETFKKWFTKNVEEKRS